MRRAIIGLALVVMTGCLGFDPSAGYGGGDDQYVEQRDQAVSGFTEKGGSRLKRTGWKCSDGAQSTTPLLDTTTGQGCVYRQVGTTGPYYCTSPFSSGPNPGSDVRCDLVQITP